MVVKTVSSANKPVVCSSAQLEVYKQKAEAFDIKDVMRAMSVLSEAIASMQNGNRRSILEMAVIKLCCPELCYDIDSLEKRIRALELGAPRRPAATVASAETKVEEKPAAVETSPTASVEDEEIPLPEDPEEAVSTSAANLSSDAPIEEWREILKVLSATAPLICGVLENSRAFIQGPYLLIDAPNPLFRDMINGKDALYRDAIRKAATQVLGQTYKLGPYRPRQVDAAKDPLSAIAEKLKQFDIPGN